MLNLDEILACDPVRLREELRGRFTIDAPLVIVGAGNLGTHIVYWLRHAGINPVAVADNNPSQWGKDVAGMEVVSLNEAQGLYANAVFVAAAYHAQGLFSDLHSRGLTAIHYPDLYWKYPQVFIPHGGICEPQELVHCADRIRAAYDLLADKRSRSIFLSQLRWRQTLDSSVLPPHDPEGDMYFPDFIKPDANEVFVDGGAWDGDTIREFQRRRGDSYRRIVAFEPDSATFQKLTQSIGNLANIHAYRAAIGAKSGDMAFEAMGNMGSRLNVHGSSRVQCYRLDDMPTLDPTYIKLDVEGAERDALWGAANILAAHRPVLAICAYHLFDDLWEIPLLIHALQPDYKLFLRIYMEDCWESVCYAVPPERLA